MTRPLAAAHPSWTSGRVGVVRLIPVVVLVVTLASSCMWITRVTEPWRAEANGSADRPVVSADGRWIAFQSTSTNLVEKDDNAKIDVFVADRTTGATVLVSRDAAGRSSRGDSSRPDISANGRFVTFQTTASVHDLVASVADGNAVDDVVRVDRDADADGIYDEPGATAVAPISVDSAGTTAVGGTLPHINSAGNQITFATPFGYLADTNGLPDVYQWFAGQGWFPISARAAGCYADDNDLAADGASAVFVTNCVVVAADTNGAFDVYRRDLATNVMSLASVATGGTVANSNSFGPVLDATGANVVWSSTASNLVSGDTNAKYDVFRRTIATGTTVRVSNGTSGANPNGDSTVAAVSTDGATIAFSSLATNVVAGDTNGRRDVFVWTAAGATTRVSIGGTATQANGDSTWLGLSGDGRFVVFGSEATNLVTPDTNATTNVFVRDRTTSTTTRVDKPPTANPVDMVPVPAAGSPVVAAALSANGRFVVVAVGATNLVPGVSGGSVYVRDLSTGTIEVVPGGNAGGVDISADGRYVAFESVQALSPNDVNGVGAGDVYVRDRLAGTTDLVSRSTVGTGGNKASRKPSISDDGMVVAFESYSTDLVGNDINGTWDVFVRDRANQRLAMASVDEQGNQFFQFCDVCDRYATSLGPTIDPSGATVVFSVNMPFNPNTPSEPGYQQITARTGVLGATPHTLMVSPEQPGPTASVPPAVWGPGGRFVIYEHSGTLAVVDTTVGVPTVIGPGYAPSVSADGRFLAFTATFDDPNPTDADVIFGTYVIDRLRNRRFTVSTDQDLTFARAVQGISVISADGRYTAFVSPSGVVMAGDENAGDDLFVRATVPPTITSVSPATVARGTTRTLTIDGDNFLDGPAPTPYVYPNAGISFGPVSFISPTRITVSITVAANAATGPLVLFVANTGTGAGGQNGGADDCGNCLSIS